MIRIIGMIILLCPCTASDIRSRLISAHYTGGFAVCAFICHLLAADLPVSQMVFGAGIGLCFMLVSCIYGGDIGMGDGMMIFALGVWVGGYSCISLLLQAFPAAGLFSAICLAAGLRERKDTLPFAPFLLFSCAASALC